MIRIDIIKNLIAKYGYKNYLEIGVYMKSHCFNHINCENKTSVDPDYEDSGDEFDYHMESDTFFTKLHNGETEFLPDMKWDLIFIDGLHLAPQVDRDILNSLEHLAEGGTIVMHDCNPPEEWLAREIAEPRTAWNGTTWKAFYKFRHTREDLAMWCVDTDWGVGIIQRGKQKLAPADNTFYEYKQFVSNRVQYLNLISPAEFLTLFGGKDVA